MRDKLSLENIIKYMDGAYPVRFFDTIGSTNTAAAGMASEGAGHGTAVIAAHQTQGKGRLGRSFASPEDSGIYMSIILEPDDSNPVLITTAAAVAVCRSIRKVCGLEPEIKWVNDIYLGGKKVCGILAESVTDYKTGRITHVILGIGVNCRASAIPDDLRDIAGAIEGDYSICQLAAEIHNQLMPLAGILDPENFIGDYRDWSMVIGKTVTVYKGGYSPGTSGLAARVLDIDNNGGLKVIYSSGQRETLSTGEISIRL